MKIENAWMLLPDRKVGFGTIETEGDAISSVSLREPGEGSLAGFSFICILLCGSLPRLAGRNFANPVESELLRCSQYL